MKPLTIFAALFLIVAVWMLAGCATSDQKQPTAQQTRQEDQNWIDAQVETNVTVNYAGPADPNAGGGVDRSSIAHRDIAVSVTIGSTSTSDKGGGAQSANTQATAAPHNQPTTTTELTPPGL